MLCLEMAAKLHFFFLCFNLSPVSYQESFLGGVSFLRVHKRKPMQRPEVRLCNQEPTSWGSETGKAGVGNEGRKVNWNREYGTAKTIIKALASRAGQKRIHGVGD